MLSNTKSKNKGQSGFTIIEVLIVLAIAGLILLIVFLAVPTLQRNQRNAGRKQDGGKLVTAVQNFVSNNNGNLPGSPTALTPVQATTDAKAIWEDAGGTGLSQLKDLTAYGLKNTATVTTASKEFDISDTNATANVTSGGAWDAAVLITGKTCNGATNTGTSITGLTASPTVSGAALVYTVETNGGFYNLACITAD